MSGAPGTATRDPALGLLDRLVQDALDQGYRDAAPRGAPRSAAGRHAVLVLGLVLVGAVLTVGAITQVAGAPSAAARKHELATAIADGTSRVDVLEAQARATSAEVDALQAGTLGSGSEGQSLGAELERLEPATGLRAVTGPGVVVTVDDAPSESSTGQVVDPDLGRVLDRDLQHVVNGLWAAGAEAVSVNGQRVTALTAIRGAGGAILVNYRPLVRPYVVTAIGDPDTLRARFEAGPAGVELDALRQTYGLRYSVASRDEVSLPGDPGLTLREAQEGGR
jgi:uncharacterized protein YlxW (UPF0749 family)